MHRCTRILYTRGGTAGGLSSGELIDNPNTPPIGRTARTTSGLPRTERSIFRTLRRCVHGRKEKSQHIRRAAGSLPKTAQIAKGRVRAALAGNYFRLMDHFGLQPKIQNSRNPMISLVAGGGFEPPTFGL